jgi:hypothetical protein
MLEKAQADRRLGVYRRSEHELMQLRDAVKAFLRALPPDLRKVANALKKCGSISEAARSLKMHRTTFNRKRDKIREIAIRMKLDALMIAA